MGKTAETHTAFLAGRNAGKEADYVLGSMVNPDAETAIGALAAWVWGFGSALDD